MRKRDRIGAITIVAVVLGLAANLWYLSSQEEKQSDPWAEAAPSDNETTTSGSASEAEVGSPKPVLVGNIAEPEAVVSPSGLVGHDTVDQPTEADAFEPSHNGVTDSYGVASHTQEPELAVEENGIRGDVLVAAIADLDTAPAEILPGLSEAEIAITNEDGTDQRFAVGRDVAWNSKTHGETIGSPDGGSLWRMRVASSSASSQNLYLNEVQLPADAELFLSDVSGEYTAGPYTADDVYNGELWTAVVPGEELILAVNSPLGSDFHLSVAEVNYGYDDFWAKKAGAGSKAAGCNVDAACQEGERWENERQSVARITIFGRWLCSATLVNNTAEDLTPYMLTAAHCLEVNGEGEAKAERAANSMVSYWNFESSQCAGQADGSLSQSQSGAILRSMWSSDSDSGNDFALVELNRTPSLSHGVYYAGWDARSIAPQSVYGIHHPRGAEMSISASSRQTSITNRGGSKSTGNGKFLNISGWDYGVTEQGSSGSGLWNEGNLLVGQLWGGLSSCDNPRQSDWYGTIASAWEGGGTPNTQLKVWLDPDDQGVNTHCGMGNTGLQRGPCNPYAISGQSVAGGGSSSQSNDTSARTVDDTAPSSGGGGGGGGGGSLGVWLLAAMVLLVALLRAYKIREQEPGE